MTPPRPPLPPRPTVPISVPPHRDSSSELMFEMVREIIDERNRDYLDGLSVRALNLRLNEHAAFDEKRHGELEGRIRELEKASAKQEGVMDTGRFQLPQGGIPQLPPVAINIGGDKHSKRPSMMKALMDPRTIAAIIGGASLLGHIILKALHF
jgi:hypothetical protein